MVTTPADNPVKWPVAAFIVPMAGRLLAQVPPGVASVSVVDCPAHTWLLPDIEGGIGLTVIDFVARHPERKEYDIVTIPAETPVTTPAVLIAAIDVSPELQDPKSVVSVRMILYPTQTEEGPNTGEIGLTITGLTAEQPVDNLVKEMIAVPDDIPVTTPDDVPTVATVGLPVLHTPPVVVSDNVTAVPTHT